MALNRYPTEIPKEEINVIINGIRGVADSHDLADRIEAGWFVTGYGMSFIPHDQPMAFAAQPLTDEQVCEHLESATKMQAGPDMAGAIPWSLIVPALIQLLQTWLQNRSPKPA